MLVISRICFFTCAYNLQIQGWNSQFSILLVYILLIKEFFFFQSCPFSCIKWFTSSKEFGLVIFKYIILHTNFWFWIVVPSSNSFTFTVLVAVLLLEYSKRPIHRKLEHYFVLVNPSKESLVIETSWWLSKSKQNDGIYVHVGYFTLLTRISFDH